MTGIYYADLFEINGVGCLIMGHGKSMVCRRFTGDSTKEIMTDSIRLDNKNGNLMGYGDASMGMIPSISSITDGIEIKYLIYMDNEDETHDNQIIEISKTDFCNIANFNITLGCDNCSNREKEFQFLIEKTEVKCIEVPWCESVEMKGSLLKSYIK